MLKIKKLEEKQKFTMVIYLLAGLFLLGVESAEAKKINT